ncbi:tetratricopeptide repeat protein [Patescibacteria group bacterium]|nr:tetratricopeptide repeat protein [Patescibacteria group bacterium]
MQKIAKRAIDAALKANWDEAIELNLRILDLDPKNINAKNRLARAYIQSNQVSKAREILQSVLKQDPINTVAKKNLKLLNSKSRNHIKALDKDSLVKEPGTTIELKIEISNSNLSSDDFIPGEKLEISKKKTAISLLKEGTRTVISEISDPSIINKISQTIKQKEKIYIRYVKGRGKNATIMIKSSLPLFKSQRQDIRPYVKKGTIEEPEIEIPENEMIETS